MPDPEVIKHLRDWQNLSEARGTQMMRDLTRQWSVIESRMQADYWEFADYLVELRSRGQVITAAQLMQLNRYQALLAQARAELESYATYFQGVMSQEQMNMLQIGVRSGEDLIQAAGRDAGIVNLTFDRVPVDSINYLIGYASDGSPLNQLLMQDYPKTAVEITNQLVTGMSRGLGTRGTALLMADAMAGNLQRALVIARTEQMRALRTAEQASIRESNVCSGYIRRSQRASNVCAACLSEDGREYETNEEFDEHPNCACYMEPKLKYGNQPDFPRAREWFDTLPEGQQADMLGPARFDAYQKGNFDWDKVAVNSHDPVWGAQLRTATLDEMGLPTMRQLAEEVAP